jgi:hypothetical protein
MIVTHLALNGARTTTLRCNGSLVNEVGYIIFVKNLGIPTIP